MTTRRLKSSKICIITKSTLPLLLLNRQITKNETVQQVDRILPLRDRKYSEQRDARGNINKAHFLFFPKILKKSTSKVQWSFS